MSPLQWAQGGGLAWLPLLAPWGTLRHCHLPIPAIIEARAGSATKCQLDNKTCRSYVFFRLIKLLGSCRDAWYRAALSPQLPIQPPPHLPRGHGGPSDPMLIVLAPHTDGAKHRPQHQCETQLQSRVCHGRE